MQQKRTAHIALAAAALLFAGGHLCLHANAMGASMHTDLAQRSARRPGAAPMMLAQNPFNPFSLTQMPEPPVSPINPGTLPGTSGAAGVTGTNPLTGRPCNGGGSLSISGAGGLPGSTSSPPPGTSETLPNIPVGTPPFTSIYGSQSSLGAC